MLKFRWCVARTSTKEKWSVAKYRPDDKQFEEHIHSKHRRKAEAQRAADNLNEYGHCGCEACDALEAENAGSG